METGWVYCFSNESMPGTLKIGMTMRDPEERIKELFTSGVPLPFKIEFAKKVLEPKKKEKSIHNLLTHYAERINPRREFFKVSPDEVKKIFDLIDGVDWSSLEDYERNRDQDNISEVDNDDNDNDDNDDDNDNDDNDDGESLVDNKSKPKKKIGCRDMRKCFTHGQKIRHKVNDNTTIIGEYDSEKNGIIYEDVFYKSLSGFINQYHKKNGTYKNNGLSGWSHTECEVDGDWVPNFNLEI